MSITETQFIVNSPKRAYKVRVKYQITDAGRIEFLTAPFALKDEIKSMKGARWHGFIEGDKRKIWSVADCTRNRFQISWLEGGNPYEWFDRDLIDHDFPKFGSEQFGHYDLMSQQRLMANTALTYHYQIWGAEMGTGKTLAAIATMMKSQTKGWWWVGPKSSLFGIKQEFAKWGLPEGTVTDMMSYEGMMLKMRTWKKGDPAPIGVVFDESQNLKTATAQRTQCAQKLADSIRAEYGNEGFVILMTGTPSPKSPADWWAPCEIAWPGFVKEGNTKAFEKRLGFYRLRDDLAGQAFNTRVAWKDDEHRCAECGQYLNEGHHWTEDGGMIEKDTTIQLHHFRKSENEVLQLKDRLDGLVTLVHKKDCLDLPQKIYKEIVCEPSPSMLRVASALTKTAPNVITGITALRALSDGFQYREVEDGDQPCPACKDGTETIYHNPNGGVIRDTDMLSPEFVDSMEREVVPCESCEGTQRIVKMKRIAREVPCPKEQATVDLLSQNEELGRIVFFAGFTGSLDRITKVCQREGWDTMRVDGRGWKISQLTGHPNEDGTPKTKSIRLDNPMDYWVENADRKIAFVAHPKSGGVALTLCPQAGRPGAEVCCFYSNDFNPASRAQAEDRIHRTGMTGHAIIVDLFHLPTDKRVLDILRQNRKLEKMSMGEFEEFEKDLECEETTDD